MLLPLTTTTSFLTGSFSFKRNVNSYINISMNFGGRYSRNTNALCSIIINGLVLRIIVCKFDSHRLSVLLALLLKLS